MKQVVESLVDGGKASAGPPLGPALGPMGVNIGKIVAKINEKTKDFQGMKVPVKVIIDPATKQFEIEVGVPPTSALVLKEAGIDKGSGDAKVDLVGNLNVE
ncbi:MAG TPA: 50S ribosomal protein L11, partial [Euryarchaeota archaeon]|nr:50S ribosomal protein L11 [Euryarchaeota archaeon]